MWSFLDRVVYINLAHRTDRKEKMENMFLKSFPRWSRFDAIRDSNGAIGCAKSHIAVLEKALADNVKNILVLEDDCKWVTKSMAHWNTAYTMVEELVSSGRYDVVSLGCTVPEYESDLRLRKGCTASSYIVNGRYIPTLLANFKEALAALEIVKNAHNESCIDQHWYSLMQKDTWFMPVPVMVVQHTDQSDINNTINDGTWSQVIDIPKTITHASIGGGLGNQLFKLAALDHVARKTGRIIYLNDLQNRSTHSGVSYMDSIFLYWKHLYRHSFPHTSVRITERSLKYQEWDSSAQHIVMDGYVQDWRYIDRSFCGRIAFDRTCLSRHPGIQETVFLHIRGGDYVGNKIHDIGLDAYYVAAIAQFPPETRFSIFTNDRFYANSKTFIKDLNCVFVEENEVDSVFLMSQCAGGICANSSFSWWGAYLNSSRKLVLPSKWYNYADFVTEGYYFPGCTIISV
uniref:Glycosyl transferase family 25 domain-containing protein n=1 Tax=viral metagenome TaxID=1070528 RepID=A0A6C0J2K7_9ZZZZ